MSDIRIGNQAAQRSPRCPYCHDAVTTGAWECPECHTPHHESCARENGRCTVLGCGGVVADGPTSARDVDALPRVIVAPAGADEEEEVILPARAAPRAADEDDRFRQWGFAVGGLAAVCLAVGLFWILGPPGEPRIGAVVTLVGCALALVALIIFGLGHVVRHVREGVGSIFARVAPILLVTSGVTGGLAALYLSLETGGLAARFQSSSAHVLAFPLAIAAVLVGFAIESARRGMSSPRS